MNYITEYLIDGGTITVRTKDKKYEHIITSKFFYILTLGQ